jgi:TolB-like protein
MPRVTGGSTDGTSGPDVAPRDGAAKKRERRAKKVRSAWISFVGRIVAQFVGSAATIVLGLILLQRHSASEALWHKTAAPPATEARVQPVKSAPVEPASVAVLPLRGFSADSSSSALATSMSDALTSELAQIPELHVASFTSAIHAAQQTQSAGEIAATLGVHYIVEGSVARATGSVRVTVRLVDAERDEHVWTHQYEQRGTNRSAIEEQIARAAAEEIGQVLISEADAASATDDAEALSVSGKIGDVARAR